jgi:hypothetical protein
VLDATDLPARASQSDVLAELERVREQVEQLQEALDSRVVIEQAKGVLSERFGWTIEDSFEILRYAARSARTPIRSIAEAIVGSGETPNAIVVALARANDGARHPCASGARPSVSGPRISTIASGPSSNGSPSTGSPRRA